MLNNGKGGYKGNYDCVCKILSIGTSLQFDLTLALTEQQCKEHNIAYAEIDSLEKFNSVLIPSKTSLLSLIGLSSENSLINSLLFINKANKTKSFIEYIVPFQAKYSTEHSFMQEVIKSVTERNLLFIEEHNILNIQPQITFTFKVLANEDSSLKKKETFVVSDQCLWGGKDSEQIGNVFNDFGFNYNYSIFYSTIGDLFKCKLNSYEEILSFFQYLIKVKREMLICLDYSGIFDDTKEINIDYIKAIGELLSISDMSLFEKKDAADLFYLASSMTNKANSALLSMNSKKSEQVNPEDYFVREIHLNPLRTKVKIGIIIDEMKIVTIIQQNPQTNTVLYHSKFDIDFLPPKLISKDLVEYNQLLTRRYAYLRSVYTGGFLSRLFNKKIFQTCITAGNESVKRIIDLLRFQFDYPTDQSFYEITVKKPKTISRQQLVFKKKEDQFLLDCTNVTTSKKRTYNPLYDSMCQSYFNNNNNRNHLLKLGFINKKGRILQDPETIIYRASKDKQLMEKYFKDTKRLASLKEKNQLMMSQIRSVANNLNSINRASSVDELNYLSKIENHLSLSKRKLPFFNQKAKIEANGCGSSSARHDLYYKEIMNSIFYKKTNQQPLSKRKNVINAISNIKSETVYERNRSVDRDHFIVMLNDFERRTRMDRDGSVQDGE